MIVWFYNFWNTALPVKKEYAPKKSTLFDKIKGCKELGDSFAMAYVRHDDPVVLERVLVAFDGWYSTMSRSQVSFLTYWSESDVRSSLEKFSGNGFRVQYQWYSDTSKLTPGDIFAQAHDTRKLEKPSVIL